MMGTQEQQGVIPRAMQQVFETSRQLGTQGWSFSMQASMLEIYNEEYKDLLAKKKLPEGKKHMVRGRGAGGAFVRWGVHWHVVHRRVLVYLMQ